VALLACCASVLAQPSSSLPPFSTFLAANSSVKQVAVDAQGYICVFGETSPDPVTDVPRAVFVARLDPTASKLIYSVNLGGSSRTRAGALALDAAGSAYVTGYTDSADFSLIPAPVARASVSQAPFLTKVGVDGSIVYSTFFSGGASALPQAILVDASGNAIVSGTSSSPGYPTTAGAYTNLWTAAPPFVTKVDATGAKLLFSEVGVGGSSLALDAVGNIFVAGATSPESFPPGPYYPTTPGAFQTSYQPLVICPAVGACMIPITAGQQYVSKLSADGSKLLYSTFVTGSNGSYNAGLAVDAAGDAWVTGDTASPDYPYTVAAPAGAPSDTFTTELDPTGSKVLLSVPVGVPPGTGNNLAFDPQGNLIAVGYPVGVEDTRPANVLPVVSAPSTAGVRPECLAGEGVYAVRISATDGSLLVSRILPGSWQSGSAVDSQGNLYIAGSAGIPNIPLTPGVYYDPAVGRRTVPGSFLERIGFSTPESAIGCVTDSPPMAAVGPVAPGQLITIYGSGIGPAQPAVGLSAGNTVPTSLAGVSVTFDGHPAPILYASANQVNVQVPFEVYPFPAAQNLSTAMQVSHNGASVGSRLFAVAPQNPSLFLGSLPGADCTVYFYGSPALALNEDGSVNSCANPAAAGSRLTLFVNGLGVKAGNQTTGMLTAAPRSLISSVGLFSGFYSVEVDSFTDQAGALSGIGQIAIRVPETVTALQSMELTVSVGGLVAGPLAAGGGLGVAATETAAAIFVKP
jgi:uncharacterized protein (TIGR03437 family)